MNNDKDGNEHMDIKIGLADTARELSIAFAEGHENVLNTVKQAIEDQTPTVTLEDDKGKKYLVRTEKIAYVELGSAQARSVGFMR